MVALVNNRSVSVDSVTVIMRHGGSYSMVNDEIDGNLIATAIMETPPTLIDGSTYNTIAYFCRMSQFSG